MHTDKEKLEKLQAKFAKFKEETADLKDTLEFVIESTKMRYQPGFFEHFLFSVDRFLAKVEKILKE